MAAGLGRLRRRCPPGEYWAGSPAARVAATPAGPWSTTASAATGRAGCWRTPPPPWSSPCCRCSRPVGGARGRRRPGCGRHGSVGDAVRDGAAGRCCRWRPSSGWSCSRCSSLVLRPAAGDRARARPPPGPRPPRVAGVGDAAAPRRGPHLALPAVRQHADPAVAARPRRPDRPGGRGVDGAADPEADHGQRRRVPRRRHAARRLRARRRLAAHRAGEDRQARVPRQLRDGRPRAQGPQAEPRRGAVGGAAAYQGQGRARRGSAARRPSCAAPPATATTAAPTTRRRGSRSPAALVEVLPRWSR